MKSTLVPRVVQAALPSRLNIVGERMRLKPVSTFAGFDGEPNHESTAGLYAVALGADGRLVLIFSASMGRVGELAVLCGCVLG